VARQWRIRHKLMLGLGLVVAVVAMLLGGALKGLLSYRTTIKIVDTRLIELSSAIELRSVCRELQDRPEQDTREARRLNEKVLRARETLAKFEDDLKKAGNYGDVAGKSFDLTPKLQAIGDQLTILDAAIAKACLANAQLVDGPPKSLLDEPKIRLSIKAINNTVDDIIGSLYTDCYSRFRDAKKDSQFSLIVVLSTSLIGVVLMAGLLRFFYRWVFYPVRDLQAGTNRIASGDFEHSIQIHSGDEFQDLAAHFNDMTARLREIYGDLARQVNERSRQLVRSERLAGVGFLAAGVAHEINNPLASIAFCSEALERRLIGLLEDCRERSGVSAEDAEVVAKYLRLIQQEAFRCKEITQRLLQFSRGGERQREPTDIAELIQGVLDVAQHLPNYKGKELLFKAPPRVIAWVNAQEIKSVVLNLVVNALDSMDEGGKLTITLGQRRGLAEMEFADTGCGMTAEVLENIFEPFFTRSRTGKGTGLGLSISHRIINQHQGEIEAVSAGPNRGSTFTVRLPLQPADDQPSAVSDQQSAEPGRDATVGKLARTEERRKAA
jgi:signal transduction histidine kinase